MKILKILWQVKFKTFYDFLYTYFKNVQEILYAAVLSIKLVLFNWIYRAYHFSDMIFSFLVSSLKNFIFPCCLWKSTNPPAGQCQLVHRNVHFGVKIFFVLSLHSSWKIIKCSDKGSQPRSFIQICKGISF